MAAWKTALLAELAYTHQLVPNHTITSIFFGGGTPSLMPPDIAAALIEKTQQLWPCIDHLEITLEANPTSVEADTFPAFKQAGINRLSIGIQSLRPEALHFLGREHSAEEALAALDLARQSFERYSFDVIYARPDQTLDDWEKELSEALALAGGHLSLYQLTIEENTAFHTAYAKGAFIMPEEELAADMYNLTTRLTTEAGLIAYEVSNYAKPGEESQHNLAYWRGVDYAGIGAGAHGRLILTPHTPPTRHASMNLKSPERWLSSVQQHGHGQEKMTLLTPREHAEERFMMGLRLSEGMAISEISSFLDKEKHAFAVTQGLLKDHPTRLIASEQGRLVLTSLVAMLLQDN